MTYYAIVPSRGCYGSGDTVHAERVCRDQHRAIEIAERMARGSSGGYRVVQTEAGTARSAAWIGHDLDRTPSVTVGRPSNALRGLPPAGSRARPAKQVTLPSALWDRVDQRAAELATSRTSVVEAALCAFLGPAE